jgi:hypothetical protein
MKISSLAKHISDFFLLLSASTTLQDPLATCFFSGLCQAAGKDALISMRQARSSPQIAFDKRSFREEDSLQEDSTVEDLTKISWRVHSSFLTP